MALSQKQPIGILDIGSNSIRFVVYEPPFIGEIPIFNEKVQCSLGRDLVKTGKLFPKGKTCTMEAIIGFQSIAKAMGVKKIHTIATAAMRDAKDGAKFAQDIHDKTGLKITIISGEKEAYYSALGVTTYFPKAKGIVGDMGGGSLELANISQKSVSEAYSYPLGALRIQAQTNKKAYIKNELENIAATLRNKTTFYAIGGTWRTIAGLHLLAKGQSAQDVRGYKIAANELAKFAANLAKKTPDALIKKYHVEQKRADLLPYSALLLSELLPTLKSKTVLFSDTSIREGKLIEILDKQKP